MITQFRVQNYKALRDVTLNLTPIHLLIGPNDSGKTSLLEALAAICRSVNEPLGEAFGTEWSGRELVWRQESELGVVLSVTEQSTRNQYRLACEFPPTGHAIIAAETAVLHEQRMDFPSQPESMSAAYAWHKTGVIRLQSSMPGDFKKYSRGLDEVLRWVAGAEYYRFEPRFLRVPVALDSKWTFQLESSGLGIARCLDDLLSADRDAFAELESRFTSMFPDYRAIGLRTLPAVRPASLHTRTVPYLGKAEGKGLFFQMVNGTEIRSHQISDGALLALAYLYVLHRPNPPSCLLIEEPENGIHPERLRQVIGILRELIKEQSHTQVVLTSHSPYIVSLFEPEEVTLCRKNDAGEVEVRPLSESQTVREQSSVFSLGEIWPAEEDRIFAETAPQEVASAEARP